MSIAQRGLDTLSGMPGRAEQPLPIRKGQDAPRLRVQLDGPATQARPRDLQGLGQLL